MSTTQDTRRAVFLAASRLLSYPDRATWTLLPEIAAYLRELPGGGAAEDAGDADAVALLARVADRLYAGDGGADDAGREERYVATFDFHEPASLYLTAHELGDSRRRGQALIELRALLRTAGFEETGDELPDYLPLLLEFLANAPADTPPDMVHTLEQRLASVCARIQEHLDVSVPYRDVFVALLKTLPEPAEPDPEKRFTRREKADTGEMPYPLHYD
jgi:nitrate reductase delta subunit